MYGGGNFWCSTFFSCVSFCLKSLVFFRTSIILACHSEFWALHPETELVMTGGIHFRNRYISTVVVCDSTGASSENSITRHWDLWGCPTPENKLRKDLVCQAGAPHCRDRLPCPQACPSHFCLRKTHSISWEIPKCFSRTGPASDSWMSYPCMN